LPRISNEFGREDLRHIGRRLRELREAREWSLKRLSVQSRVSITAIRKIESGESNPSLLTVLAIADVLGESIDRLVAASRKASLINHVVRSDLPARKSGSISLLAPNQPRMRSRLITLAARASLEDVPKDGALFAYVLEGSLCLHFSDGTLEQLAVGDSIHVKDDLPIAWKNPMPKRSVTLCVSDKRSDALAI
jgi:transcriptional regulator with XRE-family HTH domain